MSAEKELSTYPDSAWVRAARCGPNGGNCVELNYGHPDMVGVRDSKGMRLLHFDRKEWRAFLARVAG